MRRLLTVSLVPAAAPLLAAVHAGAASTDDLNVVNAAVHALPGSDSVHFTIEFDRPVDFTMGSAVVDVEPEPIEGFSARTRAFVQPTAVVDVPPADSFQMLLTGAAQEGEDLWSEAQMNDPDWQTVVRGDELPAADAVVFRAVGDGSNTDPASGGWGDVVGMSGLYMADEQTIEFYAGKSWLGLDADDSRLAFQLSTTVAGETRDVFVPTPAAAPAGLALLAGVMLRRRG